jgi:EamA-like transporter family.
MIKLSRTGGNVGLFIITVIWGSGFVVTKVLYEAGMSAGMLIAFRGAAMMILTFAISFRKIFEMRLRDVGAGMIAGLANGAGYILQAIGLKYTSPSISAFLTIIYIVLVPFVAFVVFRKKPKIQIYPAIIIALIGTVVLTGISFKHFSMGYGEWLTLAGAAIYSVSIAYLGNGAKETSAEVLSFWMGVSQFLISAVYFFGFEGAPFSVDWRAAILPLIYICIIASYLTSYMQVVCQKVMDATVAAIIMSMEAVFSTVISLIFGYDSYSVRLIIGGLLIMAGVLIAILDFRKILRHRA